MAPEGGLQHAEASIFAGEAFYSPNLAPLDLKGEGEASARRPAVDVHCTGAADAVFATDMRSGCADLVTDEVTQQHPWFAGAIYRFAVEHEADAVTLVGAHTRHRVTSMTSSRPITRTRSRR